jgi:hypothetical protein
LIQFIIKTLNWSGNDISNSFDLEANETRLAAASDKAYQLLAHGRWFSPGIPASSTTKTGHHDIAEILLNTIRYSLFCFQWSEVRGSCSVLLILEESLTITV